MQEVTEVRKYGTDSCVAAKWEVGVFSGDGGAIGNQPWIENGLAFQVISWE